MTKFAIVLFSGLLSVSASAHSAASALYCAGATLMSNQGGHLSNFYTAIDCNNALRNSRNGLFCAGTYLKNAQGSLLTNFATAIDCNNAVRNSRSIGVCEPDTE
jgi:hypothetical protein